MKQLIFQTKLNTLRLFVRNKRFLIISLLIPIFFYLLFTKVMNVGLAGADLVAWKADYLVSMMTYGILMDSVMMISSTLVSDRENGFDQLITLSPLPKSRYYASVIFSFFGLFELSIISLLVVGYYINSVTYSILEVLSFLIALPLTALPLIMIGILLSLAGSSNTVSGLANLLVFPLAIVSGLWWPIDSLPNWIQSIGKWMPTYFMSNVMKTLYHHHTLELQSSLGLILWFSLLSLCLGIILHFKRQKGYQLV